MVQIPDSREDGGSVPCFQILGADKVTVCRVLYAQAACDAVDTVALERPRIGGT